MTIQPRSLLGMLATRDTGPVGTPALFDSPPSGKPPIKTPVPPGADLLSITDLTLQLKETLEDRWANVWVEGELSNLSRPGSGHLYFKLKDANATLSAMMYRGMALRTRFELRDGMEVFARGKLSVFTPRGEYQLQIEEIHPKGIGALELAFQQLKEKLSAKGYFLPARKKPLPRFPRRIALVTSPTGAAVRDMLEVIANRWPLAWVLVCPVRVQGEGSALEISAMVAQLNKLVADKRISLDAMIVGRGGGSLEDLWAFNEEIVADAIFASKVPVISAVGHEIDITISDLVADYRGLTPSQAAAHLTPHRQEVLSDLMSRRAQLDASMLGRLRMYRQKLDAIAVSRAFRLPLERVRDQERKLGDLRQRLARAMRVQRDRRTDKLAAIAGKLHTLSPLAVLSRGYSLTRDSDNRLIASVEGVRVGDQLQTTLGDGTIVSRVESIRKEEPRNGP